MTLWLKEDTFYGFIRGWGIEDADEIGINQIRAPEDELGYKISNIAEKNLLNTDMQGLDRFINDIDGRYYIDTDEDGEICLFIYGPERASGGFEDPLPDT